VVGKFSVLSLFFFVFAFPQGRSKERDRGRASRPSGQVGLFYVTLKSGIEVYNFFAGWVSGLSILLRVLMGVLSSG